MREVAGKELGASGAYGGALHDLSRTRQVAGCPLAVHHHRK
jgi:hypothetical protein